MNDPMDCDKDGNAVTLADIFKDGTDVAEEAALNIELDKMYRYIDEELDEREKEILTKRYGLSKTSYRTDRIMTQREVADELGISRSYISRIEKKALEKLRSRFEKEIDTAVKMTATILDRGCHTYLISVIQPHSPTQTHQ